MEDEFQERKLYLNIAGFTLRPVTPILWGKWTQLILMGLF